MDYLYLCCRLLVDHFFQGVAGGNGLPAVDEKGGELASAAEDMKDFMIWAMFMTAPLFGGVLVSLDMKKCPPALLRAFDSERYEASLCTTSTMSLV